MAKTSINIKPCLVTSSGAHNRRLAEYLANIRKEKIYIRTDLMAKNETWVSPELGDTSLEERSRQIAAMVKKKTGRAMQTKDRKRVNKKTGKVTVVRGSTPIKEGVVVIKEDTAMEQLRHFCEVCKERWGITPLQIFIHRDEGHYETPGDKTTWKPNYHAHIVWDWMNHDTGKSCKLLPQDMSQMQTILAEALGMERGTSKVKRQQQQIDTLKQEVAARDETIETLQTQMQTLRADHCKELMAVQARHMTETADIKKQYEKDLSFFQMLVRKASAWFPHFRELLRMDEFCRKIGFNDAQTETLIRGKSLKYSGTLYSEMHRKQFKAENVIARISPDETNGRKFILKIDGLPIVRWFREQAEKLQHCISSRHNMRML